MWFDWGDCTRCVDVIWCGELLLCVTMYYDVAGMACGESSDSIVEKCYIELVSYWYGYLIEFLDDVGFEMVFMSILILDLRS